jgi:nicotinamide/nicotinate riboside kinase
MGLKKVGWVHSREGIFVGRVYIEMILLVGVGGSSCSGKSTLCQILSHIFSCPILHQDAFYKHDSDIPFTSDQIKNWDCPEALDMPAFLNVLNQAKNQNSSRMILGQNTPNHSIESLLDAVQLKNYKKQASNIKIVLVDGFLLYSDPRVYQELDIKLFLHGI